MTKHIHLVNADTAPYKVKVSLQERLFNHQEQKFMDAWNTVETFTLDNPGQLLTKAIWESRRIIIEEVGPL